MPVNACRARHLSGGQNARRPAEVGQGLDAQALALRRIQHRVRPDSGGDEPDSGLLSGIKLGFRWLPDSVNSCLWWVPDSVNSSATGC